MGFGVLFIGYFIASVAAFPFPEIAGFTGFAVISIALTSLAEYDKKFGYTLVCTVPLTLLNFVLTVGVLLDYFMIPVPAFITWADAYFPTALNILKLFFHLMLCYAIRNIASDTGADKLCFPATRNMFLYALCFSLDLISPVLPGASQYLVPIVTLAYFATVILYHVMIFSAYMRICDENDVDMEIKKTNIKWYDKLVEKKAEQEQKAADETKAYFQARFDEKMRKRLEKQEKSKKNYGSKPQYNHKKKKK